MKPLTHCLLLFITLLCLAASCNDDEMPSPPDPVDPDGLPLPTQTGENTFGCLINGKPWIAEIDPGVFDPTIRKIDAKYDEVGIGVADLFYLSLTSRLISLSDSIKNTFSFQFRPVYQEEEINFLELDRSEITYYMRDTRVTGGLKVYNLDTLSNPMMDITNLDTVNNVYSGKFSFRLLSSTNNSLDTLNISKGRFDVRYQPD